MIVLFWVFAGAVALVFLLVVLRGAPYVPSRRRDVERVFADLYAVGSSDRLVDIGSGDGVVLRAAARRGARALGYELNPILVLLSRWLSRHQPTVEVRLADAWLVDLPKDTTVVYIFSTSRDIEKVGRWLDGQAGKIGRSFHLLSYGIALRRQPLRSSGAHHLYKIAPLQSSGKTV